MFPLDAGLRDNLGAPVDVRVFRFVLWLTPPWLLVLIRFDSVRFGSVRFGSVRICLESTTSTTSPNHTYLKLHREKNSASMGLALRKPPKYSNPSPTFHHQVCDSFLPFVTVFHRGPIEKYETCLF